MGRNSELIRQWTILQRIATARGQTIPKLATDLSVSTRTIRRDLEALQVAGFPVYDEDRPRRQVLAIGCAGDGRAGPDRRDAVGTGRAVFQPRADRMLRRDGAAKGHHERIRQARSRAVARHEEVPGQAAPRYLGEARTCEAPGRAHLRDHSSVARCHSRPASRFDAVSLPREPAPEAVHRAPVPFDPRAGRPLSHRLRAGVRRGADVCRRAHQQSERAGDDVRTDRGA